MPDPSKKLDSRLSYALLSKAQKEAIEEANANTAPHSRQSKLTENGLVPIPEMFLPQAPGVGGQEFAQMTHLAQRLLPRGHVKKIVRGPTQAVAERIYKDGKFKLEDYPSLNLLGMYDIPNEEISINPRFGDDEKDMEFSTIMHELRHAKGGGEKEAGKIDSVFESKSQSENDLFTQFLNKYMGKGKK